MDVERFLKNAPRMLGILKRPKKILQANDQIWNGETFHEQSVFFVVEMVCFYFIRVLLSWKNPGF